MTALFIIVLFLVYAIKVVDYTYLWQIKEYRVDRIIAHIKEMGVTAVFIWRIPRLPAKSPRNVIMCTSTFIFILFLFVYLPPTLLVFVLMVIIAPFLSFILTLPAIGLTQILASLRRGRIIKSAVKKISTSRAIFIGITGSYGKTTTKEYLYTILSQQYKVEKTDEHMNTDVGVALSVLKNLKPDTQYFIAEIGAYRKGEVRSVCNVIHPSYAILTAIGNQHVALFGSQSNLVETKRELLESLTKTGAAFVNGNTGYVDELQRQVKTPITWFSQDDKDPLIDERIKNKVIASNLIPCILLARLLNMKDEVIKKGIDEIVKTTNIYDARHGYHKSWIIDNSYNTNVAGFLLTIEQLVKQKIHHKIVVSRGIIELGSEKMNSYLKIIQRLSDTGVILFTTDADFNTSENDSVRYFSSESSLFMALKSVANYDTMIAFEGKFNTSYIAQMKNI